MFADRTVLFRGLPLVVAALAFLFAPAAWTQTASCTAGNPNANLLQTTPTADFDTTATDGTVLHTKTGLMWKRCAEGQTWNGSTCTGTASALNWQNALAAAANSTFAGYTDWRLPNAKELQSIVESCGFNPAINQTIFPATPASSFWSASSYGPDPARAWVVLFNVGLVYGNAKSIGYHVRLVRGGQSFDSFDLLLGAVTVSKTVTGAAAASVPAGTNFPITLTCGATVFNANATTATPAVFTNVPPGDCTVGEGIPPTVPGVTWGTPEYDPAATVTVTAGANTPVTVTNPAEVTTYPITATAEPAVGGTVSCDPNPVPHGSGSSCTATANAGYTFQSWSGHCAGTDPTCTLTGVTAAQSVTAHFTLNSYAITVTANPTGGGTASCVPNPVDHGADSTCTATANARARYTFDRWSGDCTGADSTCTLTAVTTPQSVTAHFTTVVAPPVIPNHPLTVSKAGGGRGTVFSTPNGIYCDLTCHTRTARYRAGTRVHLVATPTRNFVGWSGACTGTFHVCTVTMEAARQVTATFATFR